MAVSFNFLVWKKSFLQRGSQKRAVYEMNTEYRAIHLNPVGNPHSEDSAMEEQGYSRQKHVLYTNTAKALVIAFGYSHSPRTGL